MRQQNQEQEFSPNGCKYQYIFQHQSATHTIHTRSVTLNTLHAFARIVQTNIKENIILKNNKRNDNKE